jgi:DNA invertase Pin-like site-specific DNA recombinase
MKTVNVAVYAMFSTPDKGRDPENQLRELRAFVERKASDGWTLAHEFVDKVSGKTADKRAAFRKMLDAASRKEFDVVLFWSLDRFSHEGVLATLQHLKALLSHGGELFSFREEYLRSIGPFKGAVLGILAAIAEQERIRLSERAVAGLSRARAVGKVLGRSTANVRPARVLALRKRGLSMRNIADKTGVSTMTAQRLLRRSGAVV